MGQFSWMTMDTGEQIGSQDENTITVTMFDDKGNTWVESQYEGYGEFGGKDYYEVVAEMNGWNKDNYKEYKGTFRPEIPQTELREVGIDIYYDDKKKGYKFPGLMEYYVAKDRQDHDFSIKPETDPHQSWSTSHPWYAKGGKVDRWDELHDLIWTGAKCDEEECTVLVPQKYTLEEVEEQVERFNDNNNEWWIADEIEESDDGKHWVLESFNDEFAKGGEVNPYFVRQSFYSEITDGKEEAGEYGTEGVNKKTGTGEDMREVYHLELDDDGRNYLLTEEEAEYAMRKHEGFRVSEEIYIDYTDKNGKKQKAYMEANSPDEIVRTLKEEGAKSIERMRPEWEVDDDWDDYMDVPTIKVAKIKPIPKVSKKGNKKVEKAIADEIHNFDEEDEYYRYKYWEAEEYQGAWFVDYITQEDYRNEGEDMLMNRLAKLSTKFKVDIYLYYKVRDKAATSDRNIFTKKGYLKVSRVDYAKGGKVEDIASNYDPEATKYQGDSEEGYSVLVKDKNSDFTTWVDVWIQDNDVITEWNQYIFHHTDPKDVRQQKLQENDDIFDYATSEAVEYLKEQKKIYDDDDGWYNYAKGGKVLKILKDKKFSKYTPREDGWYIEYFPTEDKMKERRGIGIGYDADTDSYFHNTVSGYSNNAVWNYKRNNNDKGLGWYRFDEDEISERIDETGSWFEKDGENKWRKFAKGGKVDGKVFVLKDIRFTVTKWADVYDYDKEGNVEKWAKNDINKEFNSSEELKKYIGSIIHKHFNKKRWYDGVDDFWVVPPLYPKYLKKQNVGAVETSYFARKHKFAPKQYRSNEQHEDEMTDEQLDKAVNLSIKADIEVYKVRNGKKELEGAHRADEDFFEDDKGIYLDSFAKGGKIQIDFDDLPKEIYDIDKGEDGWGSIVYEPEIDIWDYDGEDDHIITITVQAGDSTVKAYLNKIIKSFGFKTKFHEFMPDGDQHEYSWIVMKNDGRKKAKKTKKVNVDLGPDVDEAVWGMDKWLPDDQEAIEEFQDIEDNGTEEDMIDYLNNWGDEERLGSRYGLSTRDYPAIAKKIMKR